MLGDGKPAPIFEPINAYTGARLRSARMVAGMSQTELGAKLGVTYQQVQKIERGRNRMSAAQLYAAAKALKVDVNYFFEGYRPRDEEQPELPERAEQREMLALCRGWAKLTREARRDVMRLIHNLAKSEKEPT